MNQIPNNLPTRHDRHRVFVYGTLLTGHGNWSWALAPLRGTPATTESTMMMQTGPGFPYVGEMADGENEYRHIRGEVFEVDDLTLQSLDRLEGIPTHYERVMHWVITDSGERVVCWIYVSARLLDRDATAASTCDSGAYCWKTTTGGAA